MCDVKNKQNNNYTTSEVTFTVLQFIKSEYHAIDPLAVCWPSKYLIYIYLQVISKNCLYWPILI